VIALAAAGALTSFAPAQCDYSLTTYAPSDLSGAGAIRVFTTFDDGSGPVLVAGGYELLNVPDGFPDDYYSIMKWNRSDGWVPLAVSDDMYSVRAVQVFDGNLYATSAFSPFVHRWTGSGTEWTVAGEGLVGSPNHLAVLNDGSGSGAALFVIASTHSSSQSRLQKLTDGVWQNVAQFNDLVSTVEVFDGQLFVAGGFTEVSGVAVNHIAAWDGKRWSDLGANAGSNVVVTDFIRKRIDEAVRLVACGSFTLAGGVETDIAYWDGTSWVALPAVNAPTQFDIGPMVTWNNGDGQGSALCVAVTLQSPMTGDRHDRLYRLDPTTQEWHWLASTFNHPPGSSIGALATYQETASDFPHCSLEEISARLAVLKRTPSRGCCLSHSVVWSPYRPIPERCAGPLQRLPPSMMPARLHCVREDDFLAWMRVRTIRSLLVLPGTRGPASAVGMGTCTRLKRSTMAPVRRCTRPGHSFPYTPTTDRHQTRSPNGMASIGSAWVHPVTPCSRCACMTMELVRQFTGL
jgi:hypothetical protein